MRNYDGKRVAVGIRPEDFEDAAMEPDHPDARTLTAPVTLLESLGSEIMVHFRLDAPSVDSGDPDAVDTGDATPDAVGRFNPRSQVRSGQPAKIAVTTENLHFFDFETRQAIWD